ncbi:hypothetical protein Q1695_007947 [Nippostrongylus brasiliensis]|nr:hypothetical protein Q1695_007947 [Nippostrongylus brasiliensis]
MDHLKPKVKKKLGQLAPATSPTKSKGRRLDQSQPHQQRKKKSKTQSSDSVERDRRASERVQPNILEKPQAKELRSAPLHQKGAVALAAKVKTKRAKSSKSDSRSLSADEIMYPIAARKVQQKRDSSDEKEVGQSTLLNYDTCAEISAMVDVKQSRLPNSGMPMITTNKSNENRLFVGDMPFWWSDTVADITDDELVMNASVIIDVLEGRLKLVPMPDIRIVLDPIEDIAVLQARNAQCFTKEIIFGNTVRSMVNLNELSIRSLQCSSRRSRKKLKVSGSNGLQQLDMVEPCSRTFYSRDDLNETYTEDHTPMHTVRINAEAVVMELGQHPS